MTYKYTDKIFSNVDVHHLISRWDSMQEYYNPDRKERFKTLISLIKAKKNEPELILDLGCGTGSIMLECLLAFPSSQVKGIDFDFTLLALAKERLDKFGTRVTLVQSDFRNDDWVNKSNTYDVILSATALHWLDSHELAELYTKIYASLKPKGIFLNADHVGSSDSEIQEALENNKRKIYSKISLNDPWKSFWEEYFTELGNEIKAQRDKMQGNWHGVEEGLPLEWHFMKLKESGFAYVDCFYRFFNDAIYGGIK